MMSIPKIVSMMSKTARQEMIDAFYMKGIFLNFFMIWILIHTLINC